MRVVIQRVNHAQVDIDGKTVGKIGKGFLLLVGIKNGDELPVIKKAADKIAKMRIFEDEDGNRISNEELIIGDSNSDNPVERTYRKEWRKGIRKCIKQDKFLDK